MTGLPTELVAVGAIIKPHGVRGELRVYAYNPDSEIWSELTEVFLAPEGGGAEKQYRVLNARPGPKYLIFRLEGVGSREIADTLRRAEILVDRNAFAELDEGEFYLVDLVGLPVITADGSAVGFVGDVFSYPANDCLEVHCDDGLIREVPILEPWFVELSEDTLVVAELESLPTRRGARPRPPHLAIKSDDAEPKTDSPEDHAD